MRFSAIQGVLLAAAGLANAQTCGINLVDFEDLTGVQPIIVNPLLTPTPITDGYASLNWDNFYSATPSIGQQFILPQGKIFAVAPFSPATNPAVISTTTGRTISPKAIFIGSFQRNTVTNAATVSSASTVTVTATFQDGTTGQATFNYAPPNTVFGLSISAEALQYFQFPCDWANVVSLSFRPHAENGNDALLGLAFDNFQYV